MKRYLPITVIMLIALVLIISVLIFGFLQRWHVKKHTPEELASLLKLYFHIRTPEGKGPFPTIIGFHAFAGIMKGNRDWADYFVELGYATILVDSFNSRGFKNPRSDSYRIFSSEAVGPTERAGDALVALDEARKLPFVDAERLALIGWSHCRVILTSAKNRSRRTGFWASFGGRNFKATGCPSLRSSAR